MGCHPSVPEGSPEFSSVSDLVGDSKTGDVILFCGRGFFSSVFRIGSIETDWSHAGVVVKGSSRSGGEATWIVESNPPLPLQDLITKKTFKDGPQMLELESRLKTYGGYFVALRRLSFVVDPSPEEATIQRNAWAKKIIAATTLSRKSTYEYNPVKFVRAAFRSNRDTPESFFCTEFAAFALSKAEIIEQKMPFEDYTLVDFNLSGLGTKEGLRYGPPVYARL